MLYLLYIAGWGRPGHVMSVLFLSCPVRFVFYVCSMCRHHLSSSVCLNKYSGYTIIYCHLTVGEGVFKHTFVLFLFLDMFVFCI